MDSLYLPKVRTRNRYGPVSLRRLMLNYMEVMTGLWRESVTGYLHNLREDFLLNFLLRISKQIPTVYGRKCSILSRISILWLQVRPLMLMGIGLTRQGG